MTENHIRDAVRAIWRLYADATIPAQFGTELLALRRAVSYMGGMGETGRYQRVRLSEDGGYTLEQAPTPDGPWTDAGPVPAYWDLR